MGLMGAHVGLGFRRVRARGPNKGLGIWGCRGECLRFRFRGLGFGV